MYEELLKKYTRDGYIILKKAIHKKYCKQLLKKTLIPILHNKNIYLNDIPNKNIKKRKPGMLIYGKNGDHIISRDNKHFRFKPLFENSKLNYIINKIHNRNINVKKWKYVYLGEEGLGWIHLRFPFYKYEDKNNDNVKCQKNSFHLDGINSNNTINYKQSIVLLPFITEVKKNEGGTAIIPGSHKLINEYILRYKYNSNRNINKVINNIVKKYNKNIIDAIGEQGDILIMHPHLIHSPSLADIESKTRITFNISTNCI